MTDDRLYPPAAVYLTGVLARSARQPHVEGLEGFVWFDVPAPDGGVVSQPIHESLLKPDNCPLPYPGDAVAERLPGGGWTARGDVWFGVLPKYDRTPLSSDRCLARVRTAHGPEGDTWVCTEPSGAHAWHVAASGGEAVAVWPSSVVAVQQPGTGAD